MPVSPGDAAIWQPDRIELGIKGRRSSLKDTTGYIQDPPGQGPVQPAVGDPASARGLDKMTHRGPFQPLPFCDSVILAVEALLH